MLILGTLVLVFPIAAFAIQILFGRKLPRQGDWVSVSAILLSLIFALIIFGKILSSADNPDYQKFYPEDGFEWINLGENKTQIKIGMLFDNATAFALFMVTIACSLITIFSAGYMKGDSRYSRFFAYVSFFSFSMLGLILSDNLLTLFICWELMGLCSCLLIGFWFERKGVHISPADAGTKAFLTTKIGDVLLLIGMMLLFFKTGSFRFKDIFDYVGTHVDAANLPGWLTAAGILILCGAIGKSAQFPLHTWLPDAMEGPTPVSALIHAATMVAAGVFLVARMFPIMTPSASLAIAYVGGFTAIFAAAIAIVRLDIKRVLAYSTISQLGYMMLGLGVGSYMAGLFHLTTHGFFKALLFLGSGSVIHAVHTQDMREMGGLRKKMPITFWTFLIATLSISGAPILFSGFWSKDAILGAALDFVVKHPQHFLLFLMSIVAAGMTAFYMFRLVFMTFFGKPRDEEKYHHAHESPRSMTIPLIVLAVLSLAILNPYILLPFDNYVVDPLRAWEKAPAEHAEILTDSKLALATPQSGEADSMVFYAAEHEGIHWEHWIAMVLSVIVAVSGFLFAYWFYHKKKFSAENMTAKFNRIYTVLWNKCYFDELYDKLFINPLKGSITGAFGLFDLNIIDGFVNLVGAAGRAFSVVSSWIDYHIVDGFVNLVGAAGQVFSAVSGWIDYYVVDGLVNGIASITQFLGANVRRIQTGLLQNYLLIILGGIVVLILIFRALM